MTSKWREEGVRFRKMHVDGGSPAPCGCPMQNDPMQTSTQKIKIRVHWRHTVFFSCKEVGVFLNQNFVFGQKKVDIFLRYKLLRSAPARQVSPALSQMLRGSRVAAGRRMTRMGI